MRPLTLSNGVTGAASIHNYYIIDCVTSKVMEKSAALYWYGRIGMYLAKLPRDKPFFFFSHWSLFEE